MNPSIKRRARVWAVSGFTKDTDDKPGEVELSGRVHIGDVLTKVNNESLLDHWLEPLDAIRRCVFGAGQRTGRAVQQLWCWLTRAGLVAHGRHDVTRGLFGGSLLLLCVGRSMTHMTRPMTLSFRPLRSEFHSAIAATGATGDVAADSHGKPSSVNDDGEDETDGFISNGPRLGFMHGDDLHEKEGTSPSQCHLTVALCTVAGCAFRVPRV